MAFTPKFVDLVRNMTLVQGTGAVNLTGPVSGYTSFSEALQAGDTFYYCIQGVDKPAEREVGRGTMQANGTIARAAIGTPTSFSKGSKTISLVTAAEWFAKVEAQAGAGGDIARAVDRAALAAAAATGGMVRLLIEPGREGLFHFDASDCTAKVAGDPAQGLYVAPASAPNGVSGAWTRMGDGKFRPEWFGAKGDGIANDGAALGAMAAAVNAAGGGIIEMRPGATYSVAGGANQRKCDPPLYVYYSFPPTAWYVMEFNALTRPLVIRGNGATIRNASGGRFGTFNTDGTPKATAPGYLGPGASTPYFAMIFAHDCTGGGSINDLELDGNIGATMVGGGFSDAGIQLPMTGISMADNLPAIGLNNVRCHHHGCDGLSYSGPATSEDDESEQFVADRLRVHNNGRNNVSIVGGKGGTFRSLRNDQAAKNCIGSNGAAVASPPASGFDFEAEGGKIIRDWVIDEASHVSDCLRHCVVADSGTDTRRIELRGSYVGTTGYSLWLNRPQCTLNKALVVGTMVHPWCDPAHPEDNFRAIDTVFSTDPGKSPTGAVHVVNGHLIEGGDDGISFTRCTFEKFDDANGGAGNSGGPLYRDCNFIAHAGNLYCYGKFDGLNRFAQAGGGVGSPGGTIVGFADLGPSTGSWSYRQGGVTTRYPATADSVGNILAVENMGYDGDYAWTAQSHRSRVLATSPLTANRTWTVNATAGVGSKFTFTRTAAASGAYSLDIRVSGGGALLKPLAPGQWVDVEMLPGLGWTAVAGGALQ